MAKREETRVRPETQRPKRVSLMDQRSQMGVEVLDGSDSIYEYRWVNEIGRRGHRIPDFEKAGWEIAPNDVKVGDEGVEPNVSLGKGARMLVGSDQFGNPLYAILMRRLLEYKEEDEAQKQRKVDESEADIRRTLDDKTDGGSYGAVGLGTRATRTPIKK